MIHFNTNSEKSIHVKAPASIANLVCAFDVLGLALEEPCDEVILRLNNSNKVSLDIVAGDQGRLPTDPEKNTAGVVIKRFMEYTNINTGVSVELYKKLPLNSGLGSSAASAVAALVAINELMGAPLKRKDLLPFAMEGERVACGFAHADNVAPSLLGGIILIRDATSGDVIKLPFSKELFCVVVHPQVEIPTRDARRIIKNKVMLKDAISQWANVGGLVAGFCTNDLNLIGRSMQDVIIEPVRSLLIPQFMQMKERALNNGALSFGISGSGPTVFALCEQEIIAQKVMQELRKLLSSQSVGHDAFISKINHDGAIVLS